jgi:hypothetical protein
MGRMELLYIYVKLAMKKAEMEKEEHTRWALWAKGGHVIAM